MLTTKGAQCLWHTGQTQQKTNCSKKKLQGLIGLGVLNMLVYIHLSRRVHNHSIFNPLEKANPFNTQLHAMVHHLQLGSHIVKPMLDSAHQIGLKDPNLVQKTRSIQRSRVRSFVLFRKIAFMRLLKGSLFLSKLILSLDHLL